MIRGPDEMFDSAPRWTGVERAAAQSGIRIDPGLVHKLPNLVDPMSGFEGGRDCARRLQASGFEFTAVIAVDDLTALGVVRGLSEAGVRVPHDCSVVGSTICCRRLGDAGNHHDSPAARRHGTAGRSMGGQSD